MWFIQGNTFNEWKKNGCLLWIYGSRAFLPSCLFMALHGRSLLSWSYFAAGSGKSVLWCVAPSCISHRILKFQTSSTIIEDIKRTRDEGSALLAYFYFELKGSAKCDVRGLLSSLLIQLCDDSDRCFDVLSRSYTTHRDGAEQPSEATLAQCLKDMVNLPGLAPIFIIVDALDECPNTTGFPSPREKVLNVLEELASPQHPNLHICVTSRPAPDIRTVLEPLTSLSSRVSLHEESGQRDDIVQYVNSVVYSDRTMRKWRAEDKELVISRLTEKAGGM
jgi:hypothetical protein